MKQTFLIPFGIVSASLPLLAQTTVNGTIAGDNYGMARSVQGVETQFGDNLSELNAAYSSAEGGRFFLALTGNLENNFNKLEIFIDSKPGGENVFSGVPGNDNVTPMIGMTFDAGFEADYHVIVRRGFFGNDRLDLDFAELGTANFSSFLDALGGFDQGSATTGTGPANASPIEIAYDDSNVAGIIGGSSAANAAAALAVETGVEISIALSDLGSPTQDIKILAFVNGSNHDFGSNQFLGPLPAPQGNLGSDGLGGFVQGQFLLDLTAFAGDQYFDAPSAPVLGTNYCISLPTSSGSPALITASGSDSIADADLSLTATGLPPNVSGIFYYGTSQLLVPFGDSFRCVGGMVQRLPISSASAGGVLSISDVFAAPMPNTPLVAGTFDFQAWFRDPPAMNTGFSLSDGVEITFVP